jgi:hypothetical protein
MEQGNRSYSVDEDSLPEFRLASKDHYSATISWSADRFGRRPKETGRVNALSRYSIDEHPFYPRAEPEDQMVGLDRPNIPLEFNHLKRLQSIYRFLIEAKKKLYSPEIIEKLKERRGKFEAVLEGVDLKFEGLGSEDQHKGLMTSLKDWVHRKSLLIVLISSHKFDELQYKEHRDNMLTMIRSFCTFELPDRERMANPIFDSRTPQLSMVTEKIRQAYTLALQNAVADDWAFDLFSREKIDYLVKRIGAIDLGTYLLPIILELYVLRWGLLHKRLQSSMSLDTFRFCHYQRILIHKFEEIAKEEFVEYKNMNLVKRIDYGENLYSVCSSENPSEKSHHFNIKKFELFFENQLIWSLNGSVSEDLFPVFHKEIGQPKVKKTMILVYNKADDICRSIYWIHFTKLTHSNQQPKEFIEEQNVDISLINYLETQRKGIYCLHEVTGTYWLTSLRRDRTEGKFYRENIIEGVCIEEGRLAENPPFIDKKAVQGGYYTSVNIVPSSRGLLWLSANSSEGELGSFSRFCHGNVDVDLAGEIVNLSVEGSNYREKHKAEIWPGTLTSETVPMVSRNEMIVRAVIRFPEDGVYSVDFVFIHNGQHWIDCQMFKLPEGLDADTVKLVYDPSSEEFWVICQGISEGKREVERLYFKLRLTSMAELTDERGKETVDYLDVEPSVLLLEKWEKIKDEHAKKMWQYLARATKHLSKIAKLKERWENGEEDDDKAMTELKSILGGMPDIDQYEQAMVQYSFILNLNGLNNRYGRLT